ncbi:MAG: phage tail tube protein, partial [Candidatus Anammoxibacter sp.]
MSLLTKRTLIQAKIESTYGTDSVPVTGTDDIEVMQDPTYTPNVTLIERNVVRESLSPAAPRVGKKLFDISFQMELKSSGTSNAGTSGDEPQLDALLRACGMAVTLQVAVSVDYDPVSTAFESITIYAYLDGLLHKFTGCYGTWSLDMNAGEAGIFTFNFTGLYNEPTDVTFPSGAVFESTLPPFGENMTWNFGAFT